MALQIQKHTPNQKAHLGVPLGGGAGGAQSGSFTTDLSIATPGFCLFKSTEKHDISRKKRFLEENPTEIIMSRRNGNGNGPRVELKLNLSPSRAVGLGLGPVSPAQSIDSVSPPSSCVSSELSQDEAEPAPSMMVVVGCQRCLMYVMMPEDDSKCPRCKSPVLLDVVNPDPAAARAVHGVATPAAACGGAKRSRKS